MTVYLEPLPYTGVPTDGVNEVQLLTPSGSIEGGSFTITFDGEETDPIDWDADIDAIQAALEALATIGARNVVVSGDDPDTPTQLFEGGVLTITYVNELGGMDVPEVTVDDGLLTGDTPAIAPSTDTAGVTGTYRGAPGSTVIYDEDAGILYQNRGTWYAPEWVAGGPLE